LQIGIDNFAASIPDSIAGVALNAAERMDHLLHEIALGERVSPMVREGLSVIAQ
jgi:hypothetical protein